MAVIATEYGKNGFYNTPRQDSNAMTDYIVTKFSANEINYSIATPFGQYVIVVNGQFDVNAFSQIPNTAADVNVNKIFLASSRIFTSSLYRGSELREAQVFTPSINGFDFFEQNTTLAANNRIYAGHNIIYSSSATDTTQNDTVYGFTGRVTYYERHPLINNHSDLVYGGSGGIDTVVLPSNVSNFTIRAATNLYDDITEKSTLTGFLVTDNTKTVNTVQASNVERLKFSDTSVALDVGPTQNAGSVYMIYKAAFNRAPDASGMGYWLAQKDNGSNIVTNIAQGFVNSAEFTAKYGTNPSNATYIDKLYQNVLGRSGDSGGIAYWNQQLDNGSVSKAAALAAFATLPEGASNVASLIANGIPYTEFVG